LYFDMNRYPDHEELLIDIDKFDLKEYLKFLLRTKFDDLEDKDVFPSRVL
jgi:hypothetical protein